VASFCSASTKTGGVVLKYVVEAKRVIEPDRIGPFFQSPEYRASEIDQISHEFISAIAGAIDEDQDAEPLVITLSTVIDVPEDKDPAEAVPPKPRLILPERKAV
jgi:hypothetical protein